MSRLALYDRENANLIESRGDKISAPIHLEITSLEVVSRILVSVSEVFMDSKHCRLASLGLPVGEHHQTFFVVLVRLEGLLEQVNFVSTTLEVHVSPFPWLIKPQGCHLKPMT